MGVVLSEKFGVNPSVTRCIACGKEYGIAMFGTGWKDPKTGRMVGISKEAKERLFKDMQSNICYMEQTAFSQMFNGQF